MNLSTAEQMALAVLKGDAAAALALADHLLNETQAGGELRVPVRKLTVPLDRVRVVLVAREGVEFGGLDADGTREAVENWLFRGRPLTAVGIERVELYEMPPRPGGCPHARAISNAVVVEHPGDADSQATWGEPSEETAQWVAERINDAIAKALAAGGKP